MYSQFRVQNFRGFKDLELKDLARVNLIAGKNNVGKTALLEAIGILSGKVNIVLARTYSGISTDNHLINTNFRVEDLYDSKFKPINLFHQFKVSEGASILGIRIESIQEETKIRLKGENQQDQTLEFVSASISPSTIQVRSKDIFYKSYLRRFPLIILFARQKESFRDTVELFSKLKRQKLDDLLIEALSPIENEIKSIDLLAGGLHLNIPRLDELMALDEMGDGMVRLTNIILAISAVQDGILLIDEIENGLHYSIQADVWRAIAKAAELFNVQIFATTHSREMIQAAHEAFKEMSENNFRYHRLDRDKTGDIYATSYDEYSMAAAMETEAEVR